MIAAAQVGRHQDGRTTFGHALAVDPWGAVMADMGGDAADAAQMTVVDLDPAAVADARSRIPAIAHRRAIGPVEIAG